MPYTFPRLQLTPTVQAAAYSAGQSIGGLLTFQNAVAGVGLGAIVQSASVCFASGVVPTLDLILFNANPSGSTITDRAAIAVVAADLAKVLGVLHLSDATLLGAASPSIVQVGSQVMPITTGSLVNMYGALVARSGFTAGSTSDVTLSLNVLWG
jgi:hypothetical protein